MKPYKEIMVEKMGIMWRLLSVEHSRRKIWGKVYGYYRLYVSPDGVHYSNYDTEYFPSLEAAVEASRVGFDPEVFLEYPLAEFSRETAIERAPHAFHQEEKDFPNWFWRPGGGIDA